MTEKLDDIEEIAARLTMHEFALEVIIANLLAAQEQSASDHAKLEFVRVSRIAYGVMTGDLTAAQRISLMAERSAQMSERLMEKVRRREAEIREKQSRMR